MKTEKQILKQIEKLEGDITQAQQQQNEQGGHTGRIALYILTEARLKAELSALLWVIGGKPGEGEVQVCP